MKKDNEINLLYSIACLLIMFITFPLCANAGHIAEVEYYLDIDPGEGNGIPLSAADGLFNESSEYNIIKDIESAALSLGEHTLYVRAKNSENIWGQIRQLTFKVVESNPNKFITAAEYFIDSDPGIGNGIPLLPLDDAFDSSAESAYRNNISTDALTPGIHTVYVRFKDNWSNYTVASGWGNFLQHSVTDLDDENGDLIPSNYCLFQNYPNPFNPSTKIEFDLPEKARIQVDIYNLEGRIVSTLVNNELTAGRHSVIWHGTDKSGEMVASGIYFYRITANNFVETRKMTLMK